MNPEITTPKINITTNHVDNLTTELTTYSNLYQQVWQRREQRENYETYLRGLMLDIPNKSVETMMLHLHGDDSKAIRNMQHFLSKGSWQDQEVLKIHWQEVAKDLGDENGVLIVDDSGFPKQGKDTVGVKRQWCGQLGKKANCQVGVFLAYASRHGATLLDRRLYLPKEWVRDPGFAQRREKCGVPPEVSFKTKPTLAGDMVMEQQHRALLPFRWLTCDEAFGRDPAFLDRVGQHLSYLAEVEPRTRVWLARPKTEIPAGSGQGRPPSRLQLAPQEPEPIAVEQVVAALPVSAWSRHTIKEGSKGPLVAEFAALRVVAVRDTLPGPDVWLVVRRDVTSGECKYFLSNAPADTPLTTFVWLSGLRWPIETCFEDGKQEIGLGDYQVRSWTGWHHHMTLCILAHFFLVRLQLRLQDEAPKLTLPQAILLLKVALGQPQVDAAKAIDIVNYYQRRHHQAYLSHRKRRSHRIETKVSL
jgi:SRSO17 transposase